MAAENILNKEFFIFFGCWNQGYCDLSNPDALAYLQDRFKNMGVDRALIRSKVKKGEIVKIGKLEFEYDEDE